MLSTQSAGIGAYGYGLAMTEMILRSCCNLIPAFHPCRNAPKLGGGWVGHQHDVKP